MKKSRKHLCLIAIAMLSLKSYSQIKFEKGYFINNNGDKIECLIKNTDWKNNPETFEYKLSEDSESKKATIKSVKEFSVLNMSKYQRFLVDIERSSEKINALSTVKDPKFTKETLFLKLLVEGKASLYIYEDGNLRRYFYSVNNSDIRQLVYKSYLTPENKIGKNREYRRQLWSYLRCGDVSMRSMNSIDYNKRDLTQYFTNYNHCENAGSTNYEKKQKRDLFNLHIRPGLNVSSLSIQNSISDSRDANFDTRQSFRLGIEAEFIMPFNRNKWGLFIEPTYQYYKAEEELSSQTVTADYKSIELPLGVRHYFFLNNRSKVFINGAYIIDFKLNSKIDYENSSDLEIKTGPDIAFGVGYNYKNKYSVELRYGTGREVLGRYLFWKSNYSSLSVILGYNIF